MHNVDVRFLKRISVLCILFLCALAGAQEGRFSQHIEWRSNGNALEYKVEIQNTATRRTIVMTTDKTSVALALPAGSYRYRVHAFDVLGRESTVSAWEAFEILKANHPDIAPITMQPEVPPKGGALELPVDIGDVTDDTVVELVNVQTKKTVRGTLLVSGATSPGAGGSEVKRATRAQFDNVSAGDWQLRVTNPSGLFSESEPITIAEQVPAEKPKKSAEQPAIDDGTGFDGTMYGMEISAEDGDNADDWGYTSDEATFSVGIGWSSFFVSDGLSAYSDDSAFPSCNAQIVYLPVIRESWRFGIDIAGQAFRLTTQNDYYDLQLHALIPQLSLVYRHRLTPKRSFWQLRAGGGLALLYKDSAYRKDDENREQPADELFAYPVASGALSLVCIPVRHLSFELGVDYTYVFVPQMNTGIITPFISLGLRI